MNVWRRSSVHRELKRKKKEIWKYAVASGGQTRSPQCAYEHTYRGGLASSLNNGHRNIFTIKRKGKNGTENDIVYWCGSFQRYITKVVGAFIQHSECEDKEELGILGVSERASQPAIQPNDEPANQPVIEHEHRKSGRQSLINNVIFFV